MCGQGKGISPCDYKFGENCPCTTVAMYQLRSFGLSPAYVTVGEDSDLRSFGLSAAGIAGDEDLERQNDLWWKEFFTDPSKWWDNPSSKQSPRQPDFKHKLTKEPLWMDSCHNPSWVREELFRRGLGTEQQHTGTVNNPSAVTNALSPSLIWACSKNKDLQRGTRIHNELQKRGLVDKNYSDALVTMYAKCGELYKAQALLDMHNSSYIIPWTALIAGYAREGNGQKALDCFEQMQCKGILPNEVTYACILKACAVIGALDKGKKVHDEISRQGLLEHHNVLGGALVDMYAKCGALRQAQIVLEKLPSRDVVSWTALIAGYAKNRQGQHALDCFEQMQCEGILPNKVTYACILKACAAIGAIDKGKKVHDEISRQGLLEHHIVLGGALVDMYAKCGVLLQAQSVLENLPSRDVVSWNALIAGYAKNGQGQQALDCFEQMQCEGILPNEVTYACILKACAAIGAIDKGKKVHDEISRQGLIEHHIVLGGALVDMYAKCGALRQAQSVLENLPSRNVVCWNALIAGYAKNGQGQQALDCFEQMQQEGILPNEVTYSCILKACTAIGAIDKGKKVHEEISRQGLLEHHIVLGGALVDMYAKCGSLHQAQSVLEKLPSRDVVSWTALIAGYAQNGQGQQALDCFEQMQCEGILSNEVTYGCILKACAVTGAIDKGKKVHDEISRQGLLEHHIVLGGALVDMYAKCGALCQAQSVLENLPSRDVVSWTALIAGYAQNGQCQQALDCFEQMQCEGILPNEVTFCCLLNLCSHLGLVDKGQELFDSMEAMYGLKPNVETFTCMADLLGRAGHLVKAVEVIQGMPFPADSAIWHCLLGACRKWVDVSVGTWAFAQAVELDKCDGAAYVSMVNIYAAAGMPEKAKDMEGMRIRNNALKLPGCSSWTDPNNKVHEFCVGDTKHAQSKEIDLKLEDVEHKMLQAGYFPNLSWVSRDKSDASKSQLLCRHSEKLALGFALINTPLGGNIVIRKNMRMCGDCHTATLFISKIEKRKIVVMDAHFNHCFKDGRCSCNGYF